MAYRLYDLSWPNGFMGPIWPHKTGSVLQGGPPHDPHISRVHMHTEGLPGGITRQVSVTNMVFHGATHFDSPAHEKPEGPYGADIPLERCYGPGVVVDFRYMKKWDKITAEDFENAKPKIQEGDLVVVNTGWHHYWRVKEYVYHNHYPGLVPSGANWLVEHKIKAVAGPWGSLDHPLSYLNDDYFWRTDEYKKETGRDAAEDFPFYEPCHNILCTHDILAIENAGGDMDLVTGKRCTIAALPIRLTGTDGHPIRVVAIVEE